MIRQTVLAALVLAAFSACSAQSDDAADDGASPSASPSVASVQDYTDLARSLTTVFTPGKQVPAEATSALPDAVRLSSYGGTRDNSAICVDNSDEWSAVRETTRIDGTDSAKIRLSALTGDCHPGREIAAATWSMRRGPDGTLHTTTNITDDPYSRALLGVLLDRVDRAKITRQ